jgi:hypothetical protein
MRTTMRVSVMIAAVAALPFAVTPSKAQPGWVELGCQRVNFGIDRDVVRVGRRDGTFSAIRLRVRGNTVHMFDVKVVYGNGAVDDIRVRANIPAGGTTRPKDLQGADRVIDRVELLYRSRPNFRGEGVICVEGLTVSAGPPPGPAVWIELGCQRVNFAIDRYVVRVGRREGTFRAIRLRARGNTVHMFDVKVVYGNGAPDDIPVRANIPAGGSSGPLDLKGGDRVIDRVELVYRSRPNFRGEGVICVDGRT